MKYKKSAKPRTSKMIRVIRKGRVRFIAPKSNPELRKFNVTQM